MADKGYHNGADIAYCERKGIRTFIPPSKQHHRKEVGYRKRDFKYDDQGDTYICPAGEILNHELTYKKRNNNRNYRVKRYGTKECGGCSLRIKCTSSIHGRKIERANHQRNLERNNARVSRYPNYYRLRQQIVEPIFGVWKRQWHFDHVMLKTREKVEMEVNLTSMTYNLMRTLKIRGAKWLKKVLKMMVISLNKVKLVSGALLYEVLQELNIEGQVCVTLDDVYRQGHRAVVTSDCRYNQLNKHYESIFFNFDRPSDIYYPFVLWPTRDLGW
ncbi:MAG: transposase [Saprospiraceae bacterium]|nr:transposase [Saprospiraceae bacterium]